MARLVKRRWEAGPVTGLPRRDRASCDFEAYVPDLLLGRSIRLGGATAADVADAELAIAEFDRSAVALVDTEALARLLLRAESVASSRIEGLEVGARRLLRAEAATVLGESKRDVTADEVLSNIDAMTWALESVGPGDAITIDQLLETHRRLLSGTRLDAFGGQLRDEQNWIGGSQYNPCSAEFVPPPPEMVAELMEDLCSFASTDDLPVVVQAAIVHSQFETIHPFVDGNGRVGRALIHMVMRRRGLVTRAIPPVSLILATWSKEYVAGLSATRHVGRATTDAALDGSDRWIAMFATACRRAIDDASSFEERVADLQRQWRARLGRVRASSATELLIRALPGVPIVTVHAASEMIGRTYQATNEAVGRLVAAGILEQITVGARNRAFEAPELIASFTDLERRLASPAGSTRSSPPARRVPRR